MAEEKKAIAKQPNTALMNVNNVYLPMIQRQLESKGISMDQYAKMCLLHAIGAINEALETAGVGWNDKELDQSNLSGTLLTIASLKLNAAAVPAEIYFEVDNKPITKWVDGKKTTEWRKEVKMGIEGDGYDALLRQWGVGVKSVGKFWMVREGDDFEYPSFNGLDVAPPKWTPKGKGKVIRIVYPILKDDGTVEFEISERDDVVPNLKAHVLHNMMNATFGICADRKQATPDQKKKIAAEKAKITAIVDQKGLGCITDPAVAEFLSPAWRNTAEAMIVRKMRNNITRKYPKDFGNAFVREQYDSSDDDAQAVREEIDENANSQDFPVNFSEVDEETGEVKEGNPQAAEDGPSDESTTQSSNPPKTSAPQKSTQRAAGHARRPF